MGINEILQIGNKIKELRKKRGYTQKKAAEIAGIPYTTYSNYENNNREPNKEQLRRIAMMLGVSEYELLGVDPLEALKDEMTYLNFLLSIGYEYIDTFHDNDIGWDRCFYLKDGSSIPLTKSEYENLREAIIHDIELEINKIRIKNGSC